MNGKGILTSVNNLFVGDDAFEKFFQDVDIESDPKKMKIHFKKCY